MKTRHCDRQAVALLAGSALDPDEASRTRRHIDQCLVCRDYFRQMTEVCAVQAAAAQQLQNAEVSVCLHGRIATAIRAESRGWRDVFLAACGTRWLRITTATAALLLLVGGLAVLRQLPPPAQLAGQPALSLPSRKEPAGTGTRLIAYRLALNHSPEEFDRLLAHEATRPASPPVLSIRLNWVWVDAEF